MKEKETYCIRTYYKSNKTTLLLIGQWPYQSQSMAKIITYVWIFQHISIMLPEIIRFVEIRNNVDYIIESFSPITYNIVVGIKFFNGISNKEKIKAILDRIQSDWDSLTDEKDIKIMSKYATFGKLFTVGYIYMCFITAAIYLFLPITPFVLDAVKPLNESRPKHLIYLVEFFVDEEKYFFYFLAHSYVTTLAGIMPIVATDTFYASSTQHACGMLSVLGRRLENINKKKGVAEKTTKNPYQEIISCAIQHNKIIEFYENINNTYSDSFFFIMGLNMVIMSFSGVLTILKWGQFYDMIRTGMFTGAQLFHLFFYSLQGQTLMDQSLKISDCIYNSKWYTTSIKTQKIMAVMIMRSLKPFKLTAKVFIMSLPNFASVTKTSMSYFTVLKSSR